MSGIRDEILFGSNVDFTGAAVPTSTVTADGQLLIGSSVTPNIQVNTLTAGSGIAITNGHGSITIASNAPIPLTSGFFAFVSTTIPNVTGDGTVYGPVVFDSAPFNDGIHYNVATGVYTAPTTGTYLFGSTVELSGLSKANNQNGFMVLNATTNPIHYTWGDSVYASTTGSLFSFQGSSLVSMTAADTISIQVAVANTTKDVSVDGVTTGTVRSMFWGFLLSTGTGATPTTYVCNSGSAIPSANTLNVLGAGGTTTSGSGNTVTIRTSGLGLTWFTTALSTTMVVNSGYFCVSPGGALQLALPATSALGDTIKIALNGATSVQITQAAGQQIRLGFLTTTVGATGSLTTTKQGDTLEIVCMVADTIWVAQHCEGNFIVA